MVRGRILTPQIDSRSLMSEELLMLAVLEQAFSDIESGCPAVRADADAYFLAYGADSSAFSLDAVDPPYVEADHLGPVWRPYFLQPFSSRG